MAGAPSVLALIPARSGSRGIPHKNVREVGGKPLIAWSIEQALAAASIHRVVVSTDSEAYAEIARRFGAETPFLRPGEFATDLATDLEVFRHALEWLERNEDYRPDICVHLRPTHPVRRVADIDAVVERLIADPSLDAVRSVAPAPETPYKMWFRDDAGRLSPVVSHPDYPEAYNMPRQALPQTYLQNAALDAVRSRVIMQQNSMTGSSIHGYLMSDSFDIDTEEQLERASAWLRTGNAK